MKDCISHVLANSETYNISGKVALIGESAGAQLAMLWAYKHAAASSADIQGVVNLWGPGDLPALYDLVDNSTQSMLDEFFGGSLAENRNVWEDASPVTHVSVNTPPTLTVHWTEDGTVPYVAAENLKAALEELGVEHRFITYEGNEHGFGNKQSEIESHFSYFINSKCTEHTSIKEMNIPGLEWPLTESGNLEYIVSDEGIVSGTTTILIPEELPTAIFPVEDTNEIEVIFAGNHIQVKNVGSSLQLYSVTGLKIREINSKGDHTINTSYLEKGVYLLLIDKEYTYKFVK